MDGSLICWWEGVWIFLWVGVWWNFRGFGCVEVVGKLCLVNLGVWCVIWGFVCEVGDDWGKFLWLWM